MDPIDDTGGSAVCTTLMARLIDLGIDVNTKAQDNSTTLHVASLSRACCGLLVARWADMALRDTQRKNARWARAWTDLTAQRRTARM